MNTSSPRASDYLRRGPFPVLMGILNVTPDSFSDGGRWTDPTDAREHALKMIDDGAGIIDIGGESTRPGAEPVSAEEEIVRIIPAIRAIARETDVPISVDTMKASVAREAVAAGATMINDVSGLSDPDMAEVVADAEVPVILMSHYGTPATFKTDFIKGDAVKYAVDSLGGIVDKAMSEGIRQDMIITDPGVGFGTDAEQAMEMIRSASQFSLGGRFPVLIGPSRKRFISEMYPLIDRDEGTAEASRIASKSGADIIRIHNVAATAALLRRYPWEREGALSAPSTVFKNTGPRTCPWGSSCRPPLPVFSCGLR